MIKQYKYANYRSVCKNHRPIGRFSSTFYKDHTVNYTDPNFGAYSKTFAKRTTGFAIGIDYRF